MPLRKFEVSLSYHTESISKDWRNKTFFSWLYQVILSTFLVAAKHFIIRNMLEGIEVLKSLFLCLCVCKHMWVYVCMLACVVYMSAGVQACVCRGRMFSILFCCSVRYPREIVSHWTWSTLFLSRLVDSKPRELPVYFSKLRPRHWESAWLFLYGALNQNTMVLMPA